VKYIGQAKGPQYRYNAWALALSEEDDRVARQRFNRENTRVGFEAMTQAKAKQGKRGFEKEKKDEQKENIDQSTTTHLTDAVDTLFLWLTFDSVGQANLLPPAFGS
jgi:hypothetical protein